MGAIFMWIISLLILYFVIFYAVRDAINKSDISQILLKKYGVQDTTPPFSDEEIEKVLEEDKIT
jgi:hypothetical protein